MAIASTVKRDKNKNTYRLYIGCLVRIMKYLKHDVRLIKMLQVFKT